MDLYSNLNVKYFKVEVTNKELTNRMYADGDYVSDFKYFKDKAEVKDDELFIYTTVKNHILDSLYSVYN